MMNEHVRCHKAVIVEVGSCREEIDEALAPLITAIWKCGIGTMMSCEEVDPGIAWIEFDSIEDLRGFVNLVADYEDGADTLYNRINNQLAGDLSAPPWEYQLHLRDLNACASYMGPTYVEFSVGVYFPVSDIPVIVERLQAFMDAEMEVE
jgi:hypothetical protein